MNTVSGSIRTYPTWKKVSRQVESEHVSHQRVDGHRLPLTLVTTEVTSAAFWARIRYLMQRNGDDGGVGHRNTDSLSETQQRKLLLHIHSL
ncbi:hypothetical protein EVAR_74261_1 [Eumeta japonica]|uniref:Uncharacterized protein n=1 Tax=Eumeta variegata TaxID=151549 RepID=A0A4C1SCI0_EUMVA|nr:hypothetical protein EVAR_74261_1 [Eumeta japonica]